MIPVKFVQNDKLIVQKITSITNETTFTRLTETLLDKPTELIKVIVDHKDSKSGKIESSEISPTKTIGDARNAVGDSLSKVTCVLKNDVAPEIDKGNAFSKLMTGQNTIIFPDIKEEKDGKDFLFNSIVNLLKSENAGFHIDQKNDMHKFMTVMVSTLWALDGQYIKFAQANNVSRIPEKLIFKHPQRDTLRVLSHDGVKKKKVPQLTQENLLVCSEQLDELLVRPFMKKRRFHVILKMIEELNGSILEYTAYLQDAYKSPQQGKLVDRFSLTKIPGSSTIHSLAASTYRPLENKLSNEPPLTPVNLVHFAPLKRRSKYEYIRKVQFRFPVNLYKCKKPRACFIWRIPENDVNVECKVAQIITQIEENISKITKADTCRVVEERFGSIVKYSDNELDQIIDLIEGNIKLLK